MILLSDFPALSEQPNRKCFQNWGGRDLRGNLLVHVKNEAYDVVDDVEVDGAVY